MSALSPAPAPASRGRWAPPLNPLECALTDCCLSYKQNAAVSPLESALTNASHLPDSKHFESPCLDTLAHSFPATPLDSALTKTPGGGVRCAFARHSGVTLRLSQRSDFPTFRLFRTATSSSMHPCPPPRPCRGSPSFQDTSARRREPLPAASASATST